MRSMPARLPSAATPSGSPHRRSGDGCFAGPALSIAASALAMPLTKGSTPINPVCGRACACATKFFAAAKSDLELRLRSPAPETALRNSAGAGCDRSSARRGSSVSQKLGLPLAQLVAFAPAEKGARRMRFGSIGRYTLARPGERSRAKPDKVNAADRAPRSASLFSCLLGHTGGRSRQPAAAPTKP